MKKIRITAILTLTLFSVMIANLSVAQTSTKTDTKYKKVTYSVDVTCNSCKEKIGKAMAYEKGVKDCVVNVEKKLVTVTYNPSKTTVETIKRSIEKLGYKPALASTKTSCPETKICPKTSCCKKK